MTKYRYDAELIIDGQNKNEKDYILVDSSLDIYTQISAFLKRKYANFNIDILGIKYSSVPN